jgi:alkaline phosphatase
MRRNGLRYVTTVIAVIALCTLLLASGCSLNNKPCEARGSSFERGATVRNLVFMIGDGMGMCQVDAPRIKAHGAGGRLSMELMPITGLVKTYSANRLVTDSAAAGTALATGFKTDNGMISMNPEGKPLRTILEAAQGKGMSTGLVVTSSITDATPAVFGAHQKSRRQETEIASQLLQHRIDVLLGGGKGFFVPQSVSGSKRKDERNLITEAESAGYTFVESKEALESAEENHLLGLFELEALTTNPPEPSLAEMTKKAIGLLSRNKQGFFLMVEGSQIDWACHQNNTDYEIEQTLLFDEAVQVALDFAARDKQTLVIVTADHETGGMGIPGGSLDGKVLDVKWIAKEHTAVQVPVYAFGPSAVNFTGVHDNTDLPKIIARLLRINEFSTKSE